MQLKPGHLAEKTSSSVTIYTTNLSTSNGLKHEKFEMVYSERGGVSCRFANLISPNRVSPGLGGLVGNWPMRVSGLGLTG